MDNYYKFKSFLDSQNFPYEEDALDDKIQFFRLRQNLENGETVTIFFVFDNPFIDIRITDVVQFNNSLQREELLDFLNRVNEKYRIGKVVLTSNGEINLNMSTVVKNGYLIPEDLMALMGCLWRIANDIYPKLMRLKWI